MVSELARPSWHPPNHGALLPLQAGRGVARLPAALGTYERLREQVFLDFDAIVPIPLSPDKEQAGEIHRTLLLANELSRLLEVEVADVLELNRPISKRKLGVSPAAFEEAYWAALYADPAVADFGRILLIDDVCTNGTVGVAFAEIRRLSSDCSIVAATAGQMTVKSAVRKQSMLLAA